MTKNLTVGSPIKLILNFIIPMMFGLLLQQMYSLVDMMIVGKMLNENSIAAVGASSSLNDLVLGFCTGTCSGFSIPIAQKFGAGDMKGLRRYLANILWLGIICAGILTTVSVVLCGSAMRFINTPEEIYDEAYKYVVIIFLGIPFLFLYNTLSGIIRAVGDSKTPIIFLALASILNIILDIVFIGVFRTDASGTALATITSQGVSGLCCFFYMKKKFPMLKIRRDEFNFNTIYIKDLCFISMPMGFQCSITSIGTVILQSAVNALGTIYVTAMTAGTKIHTFFKCPFNALGHTMAAYSGQNVGSGKAWSCKRRRQSFSYS